MSVMSSEPIPVPSPEVQARGEQTLAEIARAELIEAALLQEVKNTFLFDVSYANALNRQLSVNNMRFWRRVDFPAVLASARPSMDWGDDRQDDDSEAA